MYIFESNNRFLQLKGLLSQMVFVIYEILYLSVYK